MEPVAIAFHPNGEQVVIHRCLGCGTARHCRVASDDSPLLLMTLPLTALQDQPSGELCSVAGDESTVA